MKPLRMKPSNTRSARTRAESKAEARRARAMVHLQRVRGQAPPRQAPRSWYAAAAVISLVAGAAMGSSFARGSGWAAGDAPIAEVSVQGANRLETIEVAVTAGVEPNTAISEVAFSEVERRLEAHAWIASARVLRLPGGRLVLRVSERVPVGVVAGGGPGRHYVVDAEGRPFAIADDADAEGLLRIVCSAEPVLQEPDADLARAVALARDIESIGLNRATEITIAAAGDPTGVSLRLAGLAPRIVLGHDDLDTKLKELARLLTVAVSEVGEAGELDLRFAGQAVLRTVPALEGAATSGGNARMRGDVQTSG